MATENETNLLEARNKFTALQSEQAQLQKGTQPEQVIPISSGNTNYEQLLSVAYHPDLKRLEAIFATKQELGYNGNLCSDGSTAFVRFYLDYGSGWEDQGYTGVAQHDIPTQPDCQKHPEKPLNFAASLQITPRTNYCKVPVLPRVRAILEWNKIPTAGDPNYHSTWGNTIDSYIQIKPRPKLLLDDSFVLHDILEIAVQNPELKLKDAATFVTGGTEAVQQADASAAAPLLQLSELVQLYKENKEVSAGRYGLMEVKSALASYDPAFIQQKIKEWDLLGLNWQDILNELQDTNANVDYEQLEAVGLDYNREEFVATLVIKRPIGYSGDLCTKGSLEYVAFWADWNNDCKWEYVGYTTVNVHDIKPIPPGGLTYAAILPYNFEPFKKRCANPQVVKIRAVLSWNVNPSSTDANKLEYWGNRLDTYIQLKPSVGTGTITPLFNIIGGIPVSEINNATGLTIAGAKFALNQVPVHEGSPFGGIIVIQGPSFPGFRYRIKVTNTSDASFYYLTNDFVVVGFLPVFPYVQYTTVTADTLTHYYNYQPFEKNTDNVLARWSPGTNDLLRIDMEIEGVAGVFTRYIQMDNKAPDILLQVNDGGDCTHFKVGDTITGSFYAYDRHILSYQLTGSFGTSTIIAAGSSNTLPILTPVPFSFSTAGATTPCGVVSLIAYEKTIYDSQWTGNYTPASRIICLQPQ